MIKEHYAPRSAHHGVLVPMLLLQEPIHPGEVIYACLLCGGGIHGTVSMTTHSTNSLQTRATGPRYEDVYSNHFRTTETR